MTYLERVRFRLRMIWAGLTMKPIAGADDPPAADPPAADPPKGDPPAADPPAAGPPKADPAKPPWGSDDDFDPDRAWKLITGLRTDLDQQKQRATEAEGKVKKHEDATKSDQQKLEERATSAETRASKAEGEAARLRVALSKGLSETQAKRLVGETEEELAKDADELLESFKAEGGEGEEPRRRPRERLRPGAAPSADADENDPAKLADAVPRGY